MTVLKTGTGLEASRVNRCPMCDRDHYCYLVADDRRGDIVKAICQWTEEAPAGWSRVSTAKDGRGVFAMDGCRRKRRHYPDYVELVTQPKAAIPQWQDYLLNLSGDPEPLRRAGTAQELAIEYFYPDENGNPHGKVVRRQWCDRRRAYENNRKTKQVRPWHWVDAPTSGFWTDRSKGEKPWALYREAEAIEAIQRSGIVFAVAGEQAVEAYRELGLTAVTCQGGEANYRHIVKRLSDAFDHAKRDGLQPVLVIHPDNDTTGERKFGEQFLKECGFAKLPAVAINPLALWQDMPDRGDIWDLVHKSGWTTETILAALETEIDQAIDRQEEEVKAQQQRSRWKAPEAVKGELGYWNESDDTKTGETIRFFSPKTDFDFQIERELISEDGGGIVLQLKLADEHRQHRVFLKSCDYSAPQRFKDALKKSLGRSVICNLSPAAIESLIRVRLHEYRITRKGKAFRLADRVGQQSDGTWVFKHSQFDRDGNPTTEERSLWVWNPEVTGDDMSFKSPEIAPQTPDALKQLVETMQRAFGSNFYPALLTLGYAAAGVHYQEIQEKEGAFPILNLYGDPGSGKTTAAECSLSLVSQHKEGMMVEISVSAAYERLKLAGGLLHCLDDPKRDQSLDEFLKGFYNAKARVVRGKDNNGFNTQKPHSPLMVTSNHACGENSAATQSRLVRLFFAKAADGDRAAFRELPNAQNLASGCFSQLLQLGYPTEAVYALEQELAEHLPNAHIRIAKSIALLLCYALKVAEMAGIPTAPLKEYVFNTLCSQVNDPEESGDSLRDFLEKLFILQSETKIGEWNCRPIEKKDGEKVLALFLPGVWAAMDSNFKLTYNRKIIENLLLEQSTKKSRQKFHKNEDESRAYQRAKLTASEHFPPNQPETTERWCYEISESALRSYSEKSNGSTRSTGSTETENEPESPINTEDVLLISPINRDQQDVNSINTALQMSVDLFTAHPPPVDQTPTQKINRTDPDFIGVSGDFKAPVDLVDLVDRENSEPRSPSSGTHPPPTVTPSQGGSSSTDDLEDLWQP